jgi:hypothetical protein
MTPPNGELQAVKEKFSGQGEQVDKLFSNNKTFRELCFNYLLCLQNLERSIQEANKAEAAIVEYENLRSKLEEQLFYCIMQQELSGSGT